MIKSKPFTFFIICLSIALCSVAHAQVISMRTGVKLGIIVCNYDPDYDADDPDNGDDMYKGTGMHVGLGMGTDLFRLLGLDIVPQYRSIEHSRSEAAGERSYLYHNIYFPVFLSLKAGMLPRISPYIGLGIGFNIIVGGHERFTYLNGTTIENPIEGSSTQGVIILGGGIEVKFSKLRLVPEFTANISGSGDETHPPITRDSNYHISIGCFYAP
ncbi:hypothetical protein JXB22_04075 [candidate division WOR-3 bacterium]|nr:hypothetical protein [candidate division WOR-3 bacterium]